MNRLLPVVMMALILGLGIISCTPQTSQQPPITITYTPTSTPQPAQAPTVTSTDKATPITTPTVTTTPGSETPTTSASLPSNTSTRVAEAQVIRVIDGDTIEVSMVGKTYTVRYIGIDTPETVHPSEPVEYFGKEASNKNRELVEGRVVRLEKDISETDKYGRLLRYVYVGDLFVNAELVKLGYAQVATYPPDVKYQEYFLTLQREAEEAGRGLWATTIPPTTPTTTPAPSTPTLSLEILSVTSPVKPGAYATLAAKTSPGAQCTITVYYKSGPSAASGLSPKNADANGSVSWSWKVGTATTPGSWRIVVNANLGGETTSQTVYFTVQ